MLPWNCPTVKGCVDEVNVWVWEKRNDQQETRKIRLPLNRVLSQLQVALKEYSEHYIGRVFLKQQLLLCLHNLDDNSMMITTDFSSQMDLVPPRKVTSHVNKHANLGVFCVYFKNKFMTEGSKEINYMECHEWYALGGCEEEGKQNDWIFHNSVLNYILDYYQRQSPHISNFTLWSDNCPGQVRFLVVIIRNTHPFIHLFIHSVHSCVPPYLLSISAVKISSKLPR